MKKISSVALTLMSVVFGTPAFAETDVSVFAVTATNRLLRFEHSRPGTISASVAISGLQPGESLVGMDFRPANGVLYGVGTGSRVYRIDPATGVATQIGSGTFSPALSGTAFGVDFNPAADRLRVVSNTEQSLRINADTGAVAAADTPLAYGSTDPQVGVNPEVTAAAYTNNRAGVTITTLLGLDSALGNMVRIGGPNSIPSPNTGVLTSLGSLGLGAGLTNAGFDIGSAKSPSSIIALAAVVRSGEQSSKLYSVDSAGGVATLIGTIGSSDPVLDIAISPNDLIAPQVLVSAPSTITFKSLRSSGLSAGVSCSEGCTVTATLSVSAGVAAKIGLPSQTIATTMIALGDSGNGTLAFQLDAAAANAFSSRKGKKLKKATITLAVSAVDAAGNASSSSQVIAGVK